MSKLQESQLCLLSFRLAFVPVCIQIGGDGVQIRIRQSLASVAKNRDEMSDLIRLIGISDNNTVLTRHLRISNQGTDSFMMYHDVSGNSFNRVPIGPRLCGKARGNAHTVKRDNDV